MKVFIDYQSSSASITFGRSCTAAELEYEHKENKDDLRYSRGKSIQSLFKCQLPGRAVLKSCEERLGLGHDAGVWEGGREVAEQGQRLQKEYVKGREETAG